MRVTVTMLLVAGSMMVGMVVLHKYTKVHAVRRRPVCILNLRQLQSAEQMWAVEAHKTTNDIPTMADIRPYLPRGLVCPDGGSYTLVRVGEKPRCSVGGPAHTLP
jgi:hypothetical protein